MTRPRSAQFSAHTRIEAPTGTVYAFLADVANQCSIADRCLEVKLHVESEDHCGTLIAARRGFGRRHLGEARILGGLEPGSLLTLLDWSGRGPTFVLWELAAGSDGTTLVRLQIALAGLSRRERLWLALGGGARIEREGKNALVELERMMRRHRKGVAMSRRRAQG